MLKGRGRAKEKWGRWGEQVYLTLLWTVRIVCPPVYRAFGFRVGRWEAVVA